MNGICAETIDNSGLNYQRNSGVSWATLQEIASKHTPNRTLAQQLWWSNSREERLLAILLYPKGELTKEDLDEWLPMINTTEIAEIFAFKLLAQNPQHIQEYTSLLKSGNNMVQLTALHTLARQIAQLTPQQQEHAINSLPTSIEQISAYRAIEALLFNVLNSNDLHINSIEQYLIKIQKHPTHYNKTLIVQIKEEIAFRKSEQ